MMNVVQLKMGCCLTQAKINTLNMQDFGEKTYDSMTDALSEHIINKACGEMLGYTF